MKMARYSDVELACIDKTALDNKKRIARLERALEAMSKGYSALEALNEEEGVK